MGEESGLTLWSSMAEQISENYYLGDAYVKTSELRPPFVFTGASAELSKSLSVLEPPLAPPFPPNCFSLEVPHARYDAIVTIDFVSFHLGISGEIKTRPPGSGVRDGRRWAYVLRDRFLFLRCARLRTPARPSIVGTARA